MSVMAMFQQLCIEVARAHYNVESDVGDVTMRVGLLLLLFTSILCAQTPTLGDSDTPVIVSFVAPAYPRAAKDQRIMGETVTAISVNSEGRVTDAKNVSAHPVFAEYVLSALKQWQFKPSHTARHLTVKVDFELSDDCKDGTDKHPITSETYVSAELPTVVHVRTAALCVETSNSQRQ